ncbi:MULTISPECIES: hypothetical protein [unclassified Pseudomonas]|uniref:hypothetical protein n=1 Tax=unclassified Pseudomonas TaxID=196821 RepID=UPI000D3D4790|nr:MULTISPECIES: hypothetical protein [unclassified Pseudomonas]RAU47052.1 hypothetical protein DBP26_009155 [Pseudomonas sp. RIT 409]RAU54669.1 hypothetical protein DBY65_010165 [Pseudomonas sp. RIT 412]
MAWHLKYDFSTVALNLQQRAGLVADFVESEVVIGERRPIHVQPASLLAAKLRQHVFGTVGLLGQNLGLPGFVIDSDFSVALARDDHGFELVVEQHQLFARREVGIFNIDGKTFA